MIITLQEYKDFKGLTTLDNETQVNLIIESISNRIEEHCNQTFDVPNADLKLICVNMVDNALIELNNNSNGKNENVVSQSFEGNSITYANTLDVIEKQITNNYKKISKYRRMFKADDNNVWRIYRFK